RFVRYPRSLDRQVMTLSLISGSLLDTRKNFAQPSSFIGEMMPRLFIHAVGVHQSHDFLGLKRAVGDEQLIHITHEAIHAHAHAASVKAAAQPDGAVVGLGVVVEDLAAGRRGATFAFKTAIDVLLDLDRAL